MSPNRGPIDHLPPPWDASTEEIMRYMDILDDCVVEKHGKTNHVPFTKKDYAGQTLQRFLYWQGTLYLTDYINRPFREMPLLINSPSYIARATAKWRLDIGR